MPYHPAREGHAAGTGVGFHLPAAAGWSLLTGGGLIAIALVLTTIVRHRRHEYASFDW